jgi:hypothetical protein
MLACTYCYSQRPTDKIKVLEETEFVPSKSGAFRIVTSNDSISHSFIREFANKGKCARITHSVKTDRYGDYFERSFYFKSEYYNEVVTFINQLKDKK